MFLSRSISSSSLEDFFLVYYAILLKSISLAVQMLWIPQLECFCHVVADAKWWDERETLWLCSPTAFNWIKIELIKDLKGVRAVLKHFFVLSKSTKVESLNVWVVLECWIMVCWMLITLLRFRPLMHSIWDSGRSGDVMLLNVEDVFCRVKF